MDLDAIALRRLAAQRLQSPPFARPDDAVRELLAVQSQDFDLALWSVGMRTRSSTAEGLQREFDDGRILRTHVLRPTWHFVHPDDLRWLISLSAPRILARDGRLYRQLALDDGVLGRAIAAIVAALDGGVHRTRGELAEALAAAGIEARGQRLGYIMMHAELEQVICSGARQSRRHTYALVDDRAPAGRSFDREAALEELAVRFFTGHGPGTARDLQAWASLTALDVATGLQRAGPRLERVEVDGRIFHLAPAPVADPPPSPVVHLLQGYDEYLSGALGGSRDVLDRAGRRRPTDRPVFNAIVLLDGQLAGHWRRRLGRRSVAIEVVTYEPFDAAGTRSLQLAAERYAAYVELDLDVVDVTS